MTSKTSSQKQGQGQGAKKRPRQAVDDRQPCGEYNYRGCSENRDKCRYAHKFSKWAGTLYYTSLSPSEQAIKGMKKNHWFPIEFQDLRLRNVNSLTESEQKALIRLPLLDTSMAPQGESKRRKKATQEMQDGINKEMEAKLVNLENEANPIDEESEVTPPMPTKEEREAMIREEANEALLQRTLTLTTTAFRANREIKDEERKAIMDDVTAILNSQLAALVEEFAQNADPVTNHRFGLVAPGELGVYRPGLECNASNKKHVSVLVRNLNEMLNDANGRDEQDEGVGYYSCRFCVRSLYRSEARRKKVICACLRCISVLYCSDWCRFNDAKDHKFSCFLHPAWVSQEGGVQWSGHAKSEVKAPADAEVPAIEATDDPKKGGQQASNDAAEDEAGQQDATKTADDGGDDVVS